MNHTKSNWYFSSQYAYNMGKYMFNIPWIKGKLCIFNVVHKTDVYIKCVNTQ